MTNVLGLTQKPEKLFWYHLWEQIGIVWFIQKFENKLFCKVGSEYHVLVQDMIQMDQWLS